MRVCFFLCLLAAVAHVGQSGKSIVDIKNIPELDQRLSEQGETYVIVVFYSPFCGACKKFHPILTHAAETLPKGTKEVEYWRLNAYENPMAMPKFHVRAFPSVYLFEKGKRVAEMEPNIASQEFLVFNWIKKFTGMPGASPFFAKTASQDLANGLQDLRIGAGLQGSHESSSATSQLGEQDSDRSALENTLSAQDPVNSAKGLAQRLAEELYSSSETERELLENELIV